MLKTMRVVDMQCTNIFLPDSKSSGVGTVGNDDILLSLSTGYAYGLTEVDNLSSKCYMLEDLDLWYFVEGDLS